MDIQRSSQVRRLAWGLAWGLVLLARPALAQSSKGFLLGPQVQFLQPQVEGIPSLLAMGPEFAFRWQLQHVQFRTQLHLLGVGGALSTTEGERTTASHAAGLAVDVGVRVAVGGFQADSVGYVFIYPSLLSLHIWRQGEQGPSESHLNEFALPLGVGHVFQLAGSPGLDVSATLLHVHVNPRTARTELAFSPGLALAFAL